MLPVNPRDLQKQLRQLKKLGVKIEQIEGAKNASIELRDKKLILENPEVFVVEFGGQKMFYIVTKDIREEALTIEQALAPNVDTIPSVVNISDEDIQFVAEYAGVSKEKARDAIFRAGGDIAKAIELLEQEKRS